jgi:hypothetical protein
MVSFKTDPTKIILLMGLVYIIYCLVAKNDRLSPFVPSNAFEVPRNVDPATWQKLNDKFGQLIQLVNTTPFQVAHRELDFVGAFGNIINNLGIGKFTVLSVGYNQQFTLRDVVVQDVDTMAVTRFSRVDFIVESTYPFVIRQVIITPDKQWINSQKVLPKDNLKPNFFRLKNPLHLFYPYATSDDDMALGTSDKILFQQTMKEKADALTAMSAQDSVKMGTVVSLPAMQLPTAYQVSSEIVGAGILHPIGL